MLYCNNPDVQELILSQDQLDNIEELESIRDDLVHYAKKFNAVIERLDGLDNYLYEGIKHDNTVQIQDIENSFNSQIDSMKEGF